MPINILLTNNPYAAERYKGAYAVSYMDTPALDVLKAARDMVHGGGRLLSHPITSGISPKESPFVSIIILPNGHGTDFDSVKIIESAIATYIKIGQPKALPENIKKDYMIIDCEMLTKEIRV